MCVLVCVFVHVRECVSDEERAAGRKLLLPSFGVRAAVLGPSAFTTTVKATERPDR